MTVFSDELAAAARTPQTIVTLGLTQCANHYATIYKQGVLYPKQLDDVVSYQRSGGGLTVTANTTEAPDQTTTADTVNFAAATDYVRSFANLTGLVAASHAFTASIWLRTAAGTGTITLRLQDDTNSQGTEVTVNVTTTWTRFSVARLFTGGATGRPVAVLIRNVGDLASVIAWGFNLTENPGNAAAAYLWPTCADDSFTENETASKCAAADGGNGARCYYSFPTCQDPEHFNSGHSYEATTALKGIKEFRFCEQGRPLPLGGEDIAPYVQAVDPTPQKIDPERAVTVNERVSLTFCDDAVTHNWNQDKAADGALTNTTTPSGTFWRRFMRIYRNYANPRNYAIVKVGFVASGMTEALYEQRGKYLLNNLRIGGDGMCEMELADALRLTKKTASGTSNAKLPAKISESNQLNGAINAVVTAIVVDDDTEVPDPDTDFTTCIEVEPGTGNAEFVNVTAKGGSGSLTVQRGRWGTTAKTHADNSPFRVVLQFGTEHSTPASAPLGKNPIDIVIEILRMCGIPMADIDVTTLQDERDTWLAGSVTADVESGILFQRAGATVDSGNGAIAQQQDAETLLSQIREVCMLSMWIGENQQVTGRVFAPARPTVTLTEVTDNESIVKDSIQVDDNEESRLTRIVVGYDLRADAEGSKLADYQLIFVRVGSDEEDDGNYGDERTKVILSPWLQVGDEATVSRLTAHLLGRFRNPARRVTFDLELKDDGVKCGDFVNLTTAHIQKPDGSSDGPRIMEVLSKQRARDHATIAYECMDTGLTLRYGFIAPSGTPDYDSATAADKRYAFAGNGDNKVGVGFDDGYYEW